MRYKLFQNPFGCYLYDSKINKIKQISLELYELMSSEKHDIVAEHLEYKMLIQNGFFDNSRVIIENNYKEEMPCLYERNLSSMTLQVTQACNFRCIYCPYTENIGNQRRHNNKRMDIKTAQKAIQFLHDHSIDSKEINIGFYGGEPLLNYSLIKGTIIEANKLFEGKKVAYTITTNASLLTDDILFFFESNNVFLTVSLDGPKEINDTYRKYGTGEESVYDIVIEKLTQISEEYPVLAKRTTINMVINPSTNFQYYASLFETVPILKKFNISVNFVDTSHMKIGYDVSEEFVALLRYYIFLHHLTKKGKTSIPEFRNIVASIANSNIATGENALASPPVSGCMYPSGPCIPGYLKCFIDTEGNIFPCEKVSETNKGMQIGNIESGYDLNRCMQLLDIPKVTEKECKDCWAFRFCTSCYVFAGEDAKSNREKRLERCNTVRLEASNIINRYLADKMI